MMRRFINWLTGADRACKIIERVNWQQPTFSRPGALQPPASADTRKVESVSDDWVSSRRPAA